MIENKTKCSIENAAKYNMQIKEAFEEFSVTRMGDF